MRRALLAAVLAAGACAEGSEAECTRQSGTICTVAGRGIAGDGRDALGPLQTELYSPADVSFTPDGRLVIVDWNNHRIRELAPDGRLRIVAGEGELGGLLGDPDEVTNRLNHPTDVVFDAQGRMVIAAWHNSRVKRLDPATGELVDIAGTGARSYDGDGGPALAAALNLPASVVYDGAGNLFVSDQANQRIRVVQPDGQISTFAGTGKKAFGGDGGPKEQASFNLPVGQAGHPAAHIARGPDGTFYLADTENNRIRRIDPQGMVSTLAGTGIAGTSGDGGPAVQAELARPVDVAVGPDGGVYIADTENNCVRVVRGGIISTVAGSCRACGPAFDDPCRCPPQDTACIGDHRPAREAHLKRPTGIAFDRDGNLYIADTLNNRIRVVWHQ